MKKSIFLSAVLGIAFSFFVCVISSPVDAQTKTDKKVTVTSEKGAVKQEQKGEKKENSESKESEETPEKIALKDVPKVVKAKIKSVYPDCILKSASKGTEDGKTAYEIFLTFNGKKFEIALTPEGEIIETTEIIKAAELPAPVTKALTDTYPGAVIKEIEKTAEGNIVKYEIEILQKNKKMEVTFDSDGKLLK